MEKILPDWLPNIHPLLIHFPIVLFIMGVLADFCFLIFQKEWFRKSAVACFIVGAVAALLTYWSGKEAVNSLMVPFQAELSVSAHADWAFYTLIYFAAYGLSRTILFWKSMDLKKTALIIILVFGLLGIGLLAKTAEKGGKLVYKYGVGTQKMNK